MSVASDVSRKHSLTANSLNPWLLESFHSFFHNVPSALDAGVVLQVYQLGAELHNSVF